MEAHLYSEGWDAFAKALKTAQEVVANESATDATIRNAYTELESAKNALVARKKYTEADGVISTKPTIIHRAKELGMLTVLRVFLIDSMAYENVKTQVTAAKPDVVEVLPGMMPKVIGNICKDLPVPVIAGGMIREKEDVMALLKAGVTSVSSTNPEIWFE